jgi:hypothetical protein
MGNERRRVISNEIADNKEPNEMIDAAQRFGASGRLMGFDSIEEVIEVGDSLGKEKPLGR